MTIPIFPLIAYMVSSAYLISWVIRLVQVISQRAKHWAHPPRMQFSLKTWRKADEENGIYIFLIGAIFGGLTTLWVIHLFVREWLLVIFIVLAVLSDEMRISSTEPLLLDVMVFFDRLSAHLDNNNDLLKILTECILELPEGRVRTSVLETILRWRSGESFEISLDAMRRIDPLLNEFVLTLQHSSWKSGLGVHIILNRLIERAGQTWDKLSRRLLIKDQIKNYVQFCRGAIITGVWVILVSSSSALNSVLSDRATVVLAVLALLGLGFIFFLSLSKQWKRRTLVTLIFIIALAAYANSLTVPISSLIQVETISHQSNVVSKTSFDTTFISTVNQRLPASFPPASLNNPSILSTSNPISTPYPTVAVTMILNPPELISTPVIPQDLYLCCLRSPHSR